MLLSSFGVTDVEIVEKKTVLKRPTFSFIMIRIHKSVHRSHTFGIASPLLLNWHDMKSIRFRIVSYWENNINEIIMTP